MDAALAVGSVALTSYMDKRLRLGAKSTGSTSLLLSFWLFSLCVLETVPAGMVWRFQYTTPAYRVVLWCMVALQLVWIPAMMGTAILSRAMKTMKKRSSEKGSRVRGKMSALPRTVAVCLNLLTWTIQYTIIVPLSWALRRRKCRLQTSYLPRFSSSKSISSMSSSSPSPRVGLQIGNTTDRRNDLSAALMGSVVATLTSVSCLRVVGPMVVPCYSDEPLSICVSWLVSIGMLISATLNGFGSVSLPFSCMAGLCLEPIAHEVVANAIVDLERTQASLQTNLLQQQETRQSVGVNVSRSKSGERGEFWSGYRQDQDEQRAQLITEASFLRGLIVELTQDITEMKDSQRLAGEARTRSGRLRSYLGITFSVVLLVRFGSAVSQVFYQSRYSDEPRIDLVTRVIAFLTGHRVVTKADADVWFNMVSLGLTGVLSASQIRTLLRTIVAVQSRIARLCQCCLVPQDPAQNSPAAVSQPKLRTDEGVGQFVLRQVLASLICCYVLACVVLTKLMLPPDYRVSFSAVVKDFTIRNEAVQATYLASTVISALVLGVLLSIQRHHTARHTRGNPTLGASGYDP